MFLVDNPKIGEFYAPIFGQALQGIGTNRASVDLSRPSPP